MLISVQSPKAKEAKAAPEPVEPDPSTLIIDVEKSANSTQQRKSTIAQGNIVFDNEEQSPPSQTSKRFGDGTGKANPWMKGDDDNDEPTKEPKESKSKSKKGTIWTRLISNSIRC